MTWRYVLALLILSSPCFCEDEEERPRVRTPMGVVHGHIKTSYGGRKFAAFEGMPYAKPPIGNRRFEPPEIPKPWQGEWDATLTTECAQTDFVFLNVTKGVEDCLYVNLYTPNVKPKWDDYYPVIIHIHGGAFMYGSGHDFAKPEYIMDRDVIFITLNYRLNIFGFLSTEDDVVSGNNGLKDQLLALQWIQHNIISFGGDPASVTLAGLSAGAASVHFHYLSPLSKGLFQRGFSQSGVAINPWAMTEKPWQKAQRLAEAVGCPTSPSKTLVKCLKQKPYEQLLSQLHLFFDLSKFPVAPFGPVIERGSKPFLSEDPYVTLHKGNVKDIPWLVSNTANEGLFMRYVAAEKIEDIFSKWEVLAPTLLDYNDTVAKNAKKSVAEKIKKFYFGEDQPNEENSAKFIQMLSDRLFLVGAESAVRLQSQSTKSPVYYYYFSYPGDGATVLTHGIDSRYFYGQYFNSKPLSDAELKMKDFMLDLLVSFAKDGKPKIKEVDWEPTKSDKLTYLEINGFNPDKLEQRTVEEWTPREFWKSLNFAENEHLLWVKDEL